MRSKSMYFLVASVSCLALAGCASDGTSMLTTASVEPKKPAPVVDQACLQLQNRIAVLRAEGTVGRVEQAAVGKTKTVNIKRESLAKVAELNKANAEFQLRCSKLQTTAAAASQSAATAPAATAQPATPQQTASINSSLLTPPEN